MAQDASLKSDAKPDPHTSSGRTQIQEQSQGERPRASGMTSSDLPGPPGRQRPQDNVTNETVNDLARYSKNNLTQGKMVNVVLFGETGVGKSSVINLIAQKDIAKVSSDVNGCTMQSTPYSISFDGMNFTIFDTIGLEEPQMGVNGYLKAIEKAYELIVKLGEAGGIHLLLFCMRGGRITATTQSNYRLFCECLCGSNVPVALVFTGLEREAKLDDWWSRNKPHIERYGIKSTGHACVTAVKDEDLTEDTKFDESQAIIRKLLKECALKSDAYRMDATSWLAKFGRGLLGFIEKAKNPKKRDVMKVLTTRCKLDHETAKKIADMIRSRDQQKADGETPAAVAEPAVQNTPPPSTDVSSSSVEANTALEPSERHQNDNASEQAGTHMHHPDSNHMDSLKDKRRKATGTEKPGKKFRSWMNRS